MGIFLYWWLGTFLYFKIVITAADFGYGDYQLTVLSSLLLATIFIMTLIYTTKYYAEKLLFSAPENKDSAGKIVELTIGKFLASSILFAIIARLVIFGFSRGLSKRINDDEEVWLIVILLLPLFLHYVMVIFTSLSAKPLKNNQTIPKPTNSESQSNSNQPLIFKDNQSAFEYACKFMDCKLEKGAKIPALVVDYKQESEKNSNPTNSLMDSYKQIILKKIWQLHLYSSLKLENGYQNTILKVASSDGGFYVVAETGEKNMDIKPDDFVMWSADIYLEDLAKTFTDKRFGWCGLVLAKLEPNLDIKKGWKILK